jgi:hypothetical protein
MPATPVYLSGFEHGIAPTITAGGGLTNFTNISGSSTVSISSAVKHSGAYSLRLQAAPNVNTLIFLGSGISGSTSHVVAVVFVRFDTLPAGGNSNVFRLGKLDSSFFAIVRISSAGVMSAQAGGGTSQNGPTITPGDGVWHRLDLHLDTSGTTWALDWQVDGNAQTQATEGGHAADTNTKAAVVDAGLHTSGNNDFYYDDILVSVTSSDYPIGNIEIEGVTADQSAAAEHQSIVASESYYTDDFSAFTAITSASETDSRSRLDDLNTTDGIRLGGSTLVTNYIEPTGDGAATAWTGTFADIDDGTRQPTVPDTGNSISSGTLTQQESQTWPDTLTWVSGDVYTLWVYGIGANKRKIQVEISVNGGTSWNTIADLIPNTATAPSAAWYSLDISSLITSQATLNGLVTRFTNTSTAGGSSGTVSIYAAYVQQDTGTTVASITGNLRYPVANVTHTGAPLGVSLFTVSREEAAGTNNAIFRTYLGGSTTDHFNADPGWGTTWNYLRSIMVAKPGGGAWTQTDINAIRFEVDSTDCNPTIWLGGFVYEVAYSVSGTTTYQKVGSAISEMALSGDEDKILGRQNIAIIGNAILAGVDASTFGRKNIAIINSSILSGVDQYTSTETGLVKIDDAKASGVDQFTPTETGAVIAAMVLAGGEQKVLNRKNIAIIGNVILSGTHAGSFSKQNIVIIGNAILSGTHAGSFSKQNIVIIGNAILSGADASTFTRKNIVIVNASILSGADASTFARKNIAIIGASILSGVDQYTATETGSVIATMVASAADATTFTRKNIVIINSAILSGVDQTTYVRTGIVIAGMVMSGSGRKSLVQRTGIAISDYILSGSKVKTISRTGNAIATMVVSGSRLITIGKTGIAIASAVFSGFKGFSRDKTGLFQSEQKISGVGTSQQPSTHEGHARSTMSLSGIDQVASPRFGTVESDYNLSGIDKITYIESGIVISAEVLSGPKTRFRSKAGKVIATMIGKGADSTVHAESGSVITIYSAKGAKSRQALRTGSVISAMVARASKSKLVQKTGLVKIDNSKVSGVRIRLHLRTGKAIATYQASGSDQHTAVRASIVKLQPIAKGVWAIDFNDDPALRENSLLEVTVEAPELLEALEDPGTTLEGGLTAPRLTDAKPGR